MMKHYPILALVFLAAACQEKPQPAGPEAPGDETPVELYLSSVSLKAADNPGLSKDFDLAVDSLRLSVKGFCPELRSAAGVILSLEGKYEAVYAQGLEIGSAKNRIDLSQATELRLEDEYGNVRSYRVYLTVDSGFPKIYVDTDNQAVISKDDYVTAQFEIRNCPERTRFHASGRIRIRGNGTSSYPKKPYKLKFDAKQGPFGLYSNKDWVLLADYSDKSLTRSAWMYEVSKAAGMPYTSPYVYVDLYINGDYNGIYILCDQVEQAKHRVNIDDDGFIVQNNNALSDEPWYFRTKLKNLSYTFKYPDPDDGEIVEGDDNYNYIVDKFNKLESILYSDSLADPVRGYRSMIDPVTFAKWYIVFETTLNYEPNLYFVMKSHDAKIQMYPAWDGEWSLGLAYRPAASGGWTRYPDGQPNLDDIFWSRGKYFEPLFSDPWFVDVVKAEWEKFKKNVPAIKAAMDDVIEKLSYAQKANFEKWKIIDPDVHIGVGLVAFSTWEEEVDYAYKAFEHRLEVIDKFLASLTGATEGQ